MTKRFLITTSVCLWYFFAFGQDSKWSFGSTTSVDFNSYMFVDNVGYVEYRGKLGYSLGAATRYTLTSKFWLSSKLLYSSKNYEQYFNLKLFQSINPYDPLLINTNDLTNQYTNNFVEIPFEMGYLLNDKSRMKIYGTFGLANSFFVSNSYKSSSTLFQANPNDKYNSYLLGAKVGFGVQFNLGKVGVFIEPQTRVYLTKVQTGMTNPVQFSLDVQVLKL